LDKYTLATVLQLLQYPTEECKVHPLTETQYAVVLSIAFQSKGSIIAKHWFNPEKQEIVIMGCPRRIHECLIADFSSQTSNDCAALYDHLLEHDIILQVFHGSMIDNKGIPDFQLVLNKDSRTHTIWIGEVGFSSAEQEMKKKLIDLIKDTTDLIFLIDIIEEKYTEPDDATVAASDLRARGFLTFEQFSYGHSISFDPVVLHGFHWITVKKISFRVCIRKEGVFDLDSDDPTVAATGTIYPNIDMAHVDAVLKNARVRLHRVVTGHALDIAADLVENLKSLEPYPYHWARSKMVCKYSLIHTAHERYKDWFNRASKKRGFSVKYWHVD